MSSDETIKTTVRLPAELHWQFQSERVRRHLSNEKAVRDALASWIAREPRRPRRKATAGADTAPGTELQSLLGMLRDLEDRILQQMQKDVKTATREIGDTPDSGRPRGSKKA
jgi:hypothetical protein